MGGVAEFGSHALPRLGVHDGGPDGVADDFAEVLALPGDARGTEGAAQGAGGPDPTVRRLDLAGCPVLRKGVQALSGEQSVGGFADERRLVLTDGQLVLVVA